MSETAEKRTSQGLNVLCLHIIAALLMLCGFFGGCIRDAEPLRVLGTMAFPLLAFMLTEGFSHSSHRGRYALRLLIFAVVSEIPFNRASDPLEQNVLWTLLLCLGMLCILDGIRRLPHIAVRIPLYAAVMFVFYNLALLLLVEFYGCGMLTAALFYFTRTEKDAPKAHKVLQKVVQTAGMLVIFGWLIRGATLELSVFGAEFTLYRQSFAVFSLPLIWLYNGEKGRYNEVAQYAFYISYPLTLYLIDIISPLI